MNLIALNENKTYFVDADFSSETVLTGAAQSWTRLPRRMHSARPATRPWMQAREGRQSPVGMISTLQVGVATWLV